MRTIFSPGMRGGATWRSSVAGLFLAACFLDVALALRAEAAVVRGKCTLTVAGITYIDGPCEIDFFAGDGSFSALQITGSGDLSYFAYVSVTGRDVAHGYWNEEPGANHAHTPLGTLRRNGACWSNSSARVCAWR